MWSWSLRLGRVNGVPVDAHWSLAPVVAWVAYTGYARAGWLGLLGSTGLLLAGFACVLVHEVAHTLQAQAINFPVRRIWLLPIGGLALLGRLPENPRAELRIALAGPVANLGLGLIFAALLGLWFSFNTVVSEPRFELQLLTLRRGPAIPYALLLLAATNLGLALFNLVPAFPFDGARILRSLLALVTPRATATRLVSTLGWLIGLGCLLLGVVAVRRLGNGGMVTMALLGITALLGTSAEEMFERQLAVLRNIPVRAAVRQPTWTLAPTDLVTPALAAALKTISYVPLVPVVEQARAVGLLPQRAVAAALQAAQPISVAQLMTPLGPHLEADDDLWGAQQALAEGAHAALPVLDGEQLHGMLTAADIRATLLEPSALLHIQPSELISAGSSL